MIYRYRYALYGKGDEEEALECFISYTFRIKPEQINMIIENGDSIENSTSVIRDMYKKVQKKAYGSNIIRMANYAIVENIFF